MKTLTGNVNGRRECLMVYSATKGIRKNLKNKLFNLSAVFILTASGLSATLPFLLTKSASAAPVTVCGGGCDYTTIQDAINNANPGDVVTVSDGTYAGSINVNKAIGLESVNGATATTINGLVTISSNDVTVSGFTVTNPGGNYAISSGGYSNLTISNNTVTNVGNSVSGNIHSIIYQDGASDSSNIQITNNNISNIGNASGGSTSGIGILDSTGTSQISNVVISGNTISGISANPGTKGAYGIIVNHATSGIGAVPGVQITNNNISGLSGWWAHAIGLEGNTPNASVEDNTISGLTTGVNPDAVGVLIEDNAGAGSLGIHGNSFDKATVLIGVANKTATQADATSNWWGDASGPNDPIAGDGSVTDTNSSSGSAVGGAVKYFGWCVDSSCASNNNEIAPTLISPPNNSFLSNAGTLQWSDVPGATGYQYQSSHSGATNVDGSLSSPIYNNNGLTNSEIDASGTAEGVFYWQARAKFADGSYGPWASPWKLTVDKTSPTAPTITNPINEQYFTAAPILNDWTDSSDANGIDHYQIEYVYDDGHTFSGAPYRETPGNQSQRNHTPNTSEQGGVKIRVRAYDAAGNVSAWSNQVHYYYDATPPNTPTPYNPSSDTNPFYTNTGFTQSWSNESVSGATRYNYESCYQSNEPVGDSCDSGATNWTHTYTGTSKSVGSSQPESHFFWHIQSEDAAGNKSAWSDWREITIDHSAPAKVNGMTVKVNGVNVGCNAVISQRPITVDWNDSADPNFGYYEYQADADKSSPYDFTTSVNTSQRSGSIRDQDGTYNYRVRAHDKAGNVGDWSDWCSVTLDRVAPVVGITDPTDSSTVNGTVDIRGSISDDNPDHYYLMIQNSSGSAIYSHTYYGGAQDFTDASIHSWDTTAVPDGTYKIFLEARDAADNKDGTRTAPGDSVAVVSVTVDNTPPVTTINNQSTTDVTPQVSGTIDDKDATLVVTVNGHTYTATISSTANSGGTYDWTADVTDLLPVGTYDVDASATDLVGNTGSDTTTDELTINAVATVSGSNPNPFTVASIQGGAAGGFGAAGAAGAGGFAGNPGANGNGQVLGANTNAQNNDDDGTSSNGNVGVEGASTTKDNKKNSSAFLGLGWWWLLVLLLASLLIYGLTRRADGTDKNAYVRKP